MRVNQQTARWRQGMTALALVTFAGLAAAAPAWADPLLHVKGTASISLRCLGSNCELLESPFETTFEFFIDPETIARTEFGSTFSVEHFSPMLALAHEGPFVRKIKPLHVDSAGYIEDYDNGRRDQGNISMGYTDGVSTVSRTLLSPGGGLDPWEGLLFESWHYRESIKTQDGTVLYKGSAQITDVAPVPEPASLLLVGTGTIGLLMRRRRKAGTKKPHA